jgi:hypothetical protein
MLLAAAAVRTAGPAGAGVVVVLMATALRSPHPAT